jgi:TP901 family phage tail tape measure protein
MNEFEVARLVARLVGDGSSFNKMMKDAEQITESTTSMITKYGKMMVEAITAAAGAFGTIAVKAFSDFNHALTESTALMMASVQQTEKMRDVAMSLSEISAKTPKDLAESYMFLASSGMNAEQAMKALPALMEFSMAGALNMSEATDLLTGSLFAIGMNSDNASKNLENLTHISNVLIQTTRNATGTTRQFARALTRDAAGTAATMGIPLEQVMSMLGAYGKAGVQANLAGGSAARSIRLLANAFHEAKEAHEEMGFEIFEKGTGKFRNLADIIDNLNQVLKRFDAQSRGAVLKELGFDTLSQRALMPLLDKADFMRHLQKQFDPKIMGDITKEIAEQQMKSFQNQMQMMKNRIQITMIRSGEIIGPAVFEITKWFSEVLPTAIAYGMLAVDGAMKIGVGAFEAFRNGANNVIEWFKKSWPAIVDFMAPVIGGLFTFGVIAAEVFSQVGSVLMDLGSSIASLGTKGMAQALTGSVARIVAGVLAYRALTLAIGSVIAVLKLLGIAQMASTVAWVMWTSTIASINATIMVFNGILAATTFAFSMMNATATSFFAVSKGLYITVNALGAAMELMAIGVVAVGFAMSVVDSIATTLGGGLKTFILGLKASNTVLDALEAVLLGVHALILLPGLAVVNGAMLVYNILTGTATANTIGLSLSTVALTSTMAALTAVMASPAFVAFVIFVSLAAPLVAGLAAACKGLAGAAFEVAGMFPLIGKAAEGPLAHINGLFMRWGVLMMDIIKLASRDMPAAWELAKASMTEALLEIKDAFPPIWAFIKEGFDLMAQAAAASFRKHMNEALKSMAGAMKDKTTSKFSWDPRTWDPISQSMRAMYGWLGRDLDKSIKKSSDELEKLQQQLEELGNKPFAGPTIPANEAYNKWFEEQKKNFVGLPKETVDIFTKYMKDNVFKDAPNPMHIKTSSATQAAKDQVEWLRYKNWFKESVAEMETWIKPNVSPEQDKVTQMLERWQEEAKKAQQEIKMIDSVLFGSHAARERIEAYNDLLGVSRLNPHINVNPFDLKLNRPAEQLLNMPKFDAEILEVVPSPEFEVLHQPKQVENDMLDQLKIIAAGVMALGAKGGINLAAIKAGGI